MPWSEQARPGGFGPAGVGEVPVDIARSEVKPVPAVSIWASGYETWLWSTCLGFPVVPEVKYMSAGSSAKALSPQRGLLHHAVFYNQSIPFFLPQREAEGNRGMIDRCLNLWSVFLCCDDRLYVCC